MKPSIFELTPDAVYKELGTRRRGLTTEEARARLKKDGPNKLVEAKRKPVIYLFFAQFTNLFAVLLLIGSAIAFLAWLVGRDVYQLYVAIAIFMVVLLNAVIGFFQEYRAEKATEALMKIVPVYAQVMRDGERVRIPAEEVVPGDVLLLDEGDHVVADARVVEEFELRINKMTLTGESDPMRATADPVRGDGMSKTDIRNLVFMGTSVAAGSSTAVVHTTGMNTEFGAIFALTTFTHDPPSPLQLQVASLAKRVATIAIIVGFLLFAMALELRMTYIDSFLFSLGVMLALVPEGLPATMSVSLALGVQRMVRENVLIKRLSSVETLGSTTVICTDKTGTLTKAEMTVRDVWVGGRSIAVSGAGYEPVGEFLENDKTLSKQDVDRACGLLLTTATLASNAKLVAPHEGEPSWTIVGDTTEGALIVAAQKAGLSQDELLEDNRRVYQFPFDSNRKRMSSIHRTDRKLISHVKGAPREILENCTHIALNGKVERLTKQQRDKVLKVNDDYAKASLRVLAMAYRDMPRGKRKFTEDEAETHLTFIGLMGMADPPRPEVAEAVRKAQHAGIRIIMVTGDYGLTAEAIARRVGIVRGKRCHIVTGPELDAMPDEELRKRLAAHYEILFARVSPQHKLRIATLLRGAGETVAITGDGVNDAPALKAADIGVAMGITGTDVSKEAAVMILLDDSFASIVTAIEQGRGVYSNIKKFILYIFSHNLAELFPIVFAVVARVNLVPLWALQVLAIDLASDVMPSLALGTEPPEPGVMDQPPRPRSERLMNWPAVKRLIFIGVVQSIGAVAGFLIVLLQGGWHWGQALNINTSLLYQQAVTMTHGGIVFGQFFNGLAIRTEKVSIFKIGLFTNRRLIAAEVLGVLIFAAISYVPMLQKVFHTGPLEPKHWLMLIGFGLFLFAAEEGRKLVMRWREKEKE